MTTVVTIAEAAKQIGKAPQWLRRHLLAVERETGRRVLVLRGRPGSKRPTYHVHMGRLRAACPELFDDRDKLAAAFRESVLIGRREILDLKNVVDELACNVDVLTEAVSRLTRTPIGRNRARPAKRDPQG